MALSPNMNVMIRAAEKAGRSLVRDFGEVEQLQVSRKGPGDFVSSADLRAEEIIYNELKRARPEYDFLMEERGEVKENNSDTRWIVDPLDGTTNFLHAIPHWCISIALEEKGEVTAAVVYDPIKNELFRAEKGIAAFMKNHRLRASGRSDPEHSMIATGAPRRAPESRAQFNEEYRTMQQAGYSVRRFGAAALDLAYVAAGRCEGFWERDLQPWDIAAGYLIIKESGGLVSDIESRDNPIYTGNVLAANQSLFQDIKKQLTTAKQGKDAA